MKSKFFYIILITLITVSCLNKTSKIDNNNSVVVDQQLNTITFEVKVDDTEVFEDGIQTWASIEKPELDLPNLLKKDEVVIPEKTITIVIDYPLTNEYKFELKSENGFTRAELLTEISKHYHKLYDEEENSASVKTLPMDKRKIVNRNQTNGKYGIWGHDIGDLVLTEIQVHRADNGEVILSLGIDS